MDLGLNPPRVVRQREQDGGSQSSSTGAWSSAMHGDMGARSNRRRSREMMGELRARSSSVRKKREAVADCMSLPSTCLIPKTIRIYDAWRWQCPRTPEQKTCGTS